MCTIGLTTKECIHTVGFHSSELINIPQSLLQGSNKKILQWALTCL